MASEIWLLLWNMAYLFDKTASYRPWLGWIGVDIRRLGIEDFVRPIWFSVDLCLILMTACYQCSLPEKAVA